MFSFTGTSAYKKTQGMHGCAVRYTDFFLKPEMSFSTSPDAFELNFNMTFRSLHS
jgi:hypothetical protein